MFIIYKYICLFVFFDCFSESYLPAMSTAPNPLPHHAWPWSGPTSAKVSTSCHVNVKMTPSWLQGVFQINLHGILQQMTRLHIHLPQYENLYSNERSIPADRLAKCKRMSSFGYCTEKTNLTRRCKAAEIKTQRVVGYNIQSSHTQPLVYHLINTLFLGFSYHLYNQYLLRQWTKPKPRC